MKSRYVVIAGIAVVAFVLSAGLAWGAGGNRMHRNMPANVQGMSTEEMQEFCQETHDQMGSMMGGSGMGGSGMGMGGSGMGGSGMGGSGMGGSGMGGSGMGGNR